MENQIKHYENRSLEDIIYFCEIDLIQKTEQWKDVIDWEGLYKISDLGRLKRLKFNKIRRWKRDKLVTDKICKPCFDKNKYLRFGLYHNHRAKTNKAHRLVAEAFIPNPENKPQVNHINGIKTDNRVENLEWNTNKENIHHAISIGLISSKGEKNNSSILTENQVLEIRNSDLLRSELALLYNVNWTTINNIKKNKTWKHLK